MQFKKRYALTDKGLAQLVPSAIEVPSGANGTGQLVPPVPHPFRGGTGTDTVADTSHTVLEFERGDA